MDTGCGGHNRRALIRLVDNKSNNKGDQQNKADQYIEPVSFDKRRHMSPQRDARVAVAGNGKTIQNDKAQSFFLCIL